MEGAAAAAGEGGAGDGDEGLGAGGLAGVVGVVEAVHEGARGRVGAAAGADAQRQQLAAGGQVVGVVGDGLIEQGLGAGGVASHEAQAGVHAQAWVHRLALAWPFGQEGLGVVVGAGGEEGVGEGEAEGLVGGGATEGVLQEGGGALGVGVGEGIEGGGEGGDGSGWRALRTFLHGCGVVELGDLDLARRALVERVVGVGDLGARGRHDRRGALGAGGARGESEEQ
nr:hypothetical protein [Nannocystis sp.]